MPDTPKKPTLPVGRPLLTLRPKKPSARFETRHPRSQRRGQTRGGRPPRIPGRTGGR